MADPLGRLPARQRARLRRGPAPTRFEAMKAVLTDERFSDPEWLYERKLDGIRCLAVRDGGRVRLRSRNDLSLDRRYPELVEALSRDRTRRFAVDGEVVAFSRARTSFARLGERGRHPGIPVFLYVFDLLWLDGHDLRELPLRARKAVLRRTLGFRGPVRWTPYRYRDGEALYREACRRGWEGVIAKRADSLYARARSRDWLKFKCENQQELVVGGYTAPRGSREELGALLLGYQQDGELRYAGKVGTGFDREALHELARRLGPLRRDASPFAGDDAPARDTTWVQPRLVAQVAFTEWTRDGRLRHPRYLGLREDKDARDVVRERPGPGR